MYDYHNFFINKRYKTKVNNKEIESHLKLEDDYKPRGEQDRNHDDRLMYVLLTLGLGNLIYIFNENNISFTDFLLLSKESLKDLGLEMYQRNRIYNFATSFNKNAKTYSIKEISDFFNDNKQFLFSPLILNKLISINKSQNFDIKNNRNIYENEGNKYFSDDESNNYDIIKYSRIGTTNKLRNRKKNSNSGVKSYKAGKIFKNYLLIKKGVDEFLNKINKKKEESENISYKYNAIIKKINNQKDNNINNNSDKNSIKKIININEDNEAIIDLLKDKNLDKNLNNENNKNEEYIKLIDKLSKIEKMKIDENSSENINQIKNYINEKGLNLKNNDISSLQNELDKMTEIINKKQKLKENLEKYNKKIEQSKKMINRLENEYNGINLQKFEDK